MRAWGLEWIGHSERPPFSELHAAQCNCPWAPQVYKIHLGRVADGPLGPLEDALHFSIIVYICCDTSVPRPAQLRL